MTLGIIRASIEHLAKSTFIPRFAVFETVSFSEVDCTVSCDFGLACSCLLTFCVQKCSALGSCARGHAAEACRGCGENQHRRERRTDSVG